MSNPLLDKLSEKTIVHRVRPGVCDGGKGRPRIEVVRRNQSEYGSVDFIIGREMSNLLMIDSRGAKCFAEFFQALYEDLSS